MQRPKWWEYNTAGEYLYDQYKYIKAVKKITTKDLVSSLDFTNRSSLFNLFSNHVYIKIDNIKFYCEIFFLNKEEGEYLRILTLHHKASSEFEKRFWNKKVEEFIEKRKSVVPEKNHNSEMFNMWDSFIKAEKDFDFSSNREYVST